MGAACAAASGALQSDAQVARRLRPARARALAAHEQAQDFFAKASGSNDILNRLGALAQ
ncbi:unnamed protein product, partial [Prorocentrum cordatum]